MTLKYFDVHNCCSQRASSGTCVSERRLANLAELITGTSGLFV
jgi:hypothetical protein